MSTSGNVFVLHPSLCPLGKQGIKQVGIAPRGTDFTVSSFVSSTQLDETHFHQCSVNLDGSYQLERHNTIFELLAWETLQNLMLAPHATAPGTR